MNSAVRAVPFSEAASCGRLDAHHFIPVHRTWEHYSPKPNLSAGDVVILWMEGKLPEVEMRKAMELKWPGQERWP